MKMSENVTTMCSDTVLESGCRRGHTDGVLSEHWLGRGAGVSFSHHILSADSELVLTALQQVWDPVLHLGVDTLLVAADPPVDP